MHAAADDQTGHSLVPFSTERAIDAAIAADEEGFADLLVDFAHELRRPRASRPPDLRGSLPQRPHPGPVGQDGPELLRAGHQAPLGPLTALVAHSPRDEHMRTSQRTCGRSSSPCCRHALRSAHVLLSRVPLPLATLLAVGGVIFLLAFALADRERGFGRIAGLLIPLELPADTVFTTGQHACYGPTGGPVTGPLRSVGVDLLCGGGTVGTPLARVAARRPSPAAAAPLARDRAPPLPGCCSAAHVAVGLAAAAWLRRGEAALAELLRAVAGDRLPAAALAFAAWRWRAPRAPPRRLRCAARAAARAPPLLTHSVHRRGPPSLGLAPARAPRPSLRSAVPQFPARMRDVPRRTAP